MSKKGIHRRKILADGELTVLDFADATSPRDKVRKGKSLKMIKPQPLEDSSEVLDMEFEVNANEIKPRRRRNKVEEDPNHVYNDYIIDIWWLISEYIRPEDVGRFALICKKTESIVATARFWINLYKRYYCGHKELPLDLQPDCIKRLGGLRPRVIRSLLYTYTPFTVRLERRSTNVDSLIDLQCVGSWHKNEGKTWVYGLKLFNGLKARQPRIVDSNNGVDDNDGDDDLEAFLSQFNNIFDNPDEGCCILVFVATRYYPLPSFWGSQRLYLTGIRQPLSMDLSHFNLELSFSNYRKQVIERAIFPIQNLGIIHWWSPDYRVFSNPL